MGRQKEAALRGQKPHRDLDERVIHDNVLWGEGARVLGEGFLARVSCEKRALVRNAHLRGRDAA